MIHYHYRCKNSTKFLTQIFIRTVFLIQQVWRTPHDCIQSTELLSLWLGVWWVWEIIIQECWWVGQWQYDNDGHGMTLMGRVVTIEKLAINCTDRSSPILEWEVLDAQRIKKALEAPHRIFKTHPPGKMQEKKNLWAIFVGHMMSQCQKNM
jgi:hypothetical protein